MHASAMNWVRRFVSMLPQRHRVCELGSRDVNGSVRSLFPKATYVGVDYVAGRGVDIVANAGYWRPENGVTFDTVVSTECLEHAKEADLICKTAYDILEPGGVFILTAAGMNRGPHSGIDGGALRLGEFYRNVTEASLRQWLSPFLVSVIDTICQGDIYAFAVKG